MFFDWHQFLFFRYTLSSQPRGESCGTTSNLPIIEDGEISFSPPIFTMDEIAIEWRAPRQADFDP